jgi:hypothetical protein
LCVCGCFYPLNSIIINVNIHEELIYTMSKELTFFSTSVVLFNTRKNILWWKKYKEINEKKIMCEIGIEDWKECNSFFWTWKNRQKRNKDGDEALNHPYLIVFECLFVQKQLSCVCLLLMLLLWRRLSNFRTFKIYLLLFWAEWEGENERENGFSCFFLISSWFRFGNNDACRCLKDYLLLYSLHNNNNSHSSKAKHLQEMKSKKLKATNDEIAKRSKSFYR